jgi:hypothetical protein
MLPPYVVEGINLGKSTISPNKVPLSEIDQTSINIVIDKIKKSYGKQNIQLPSFARCFLSLGLTLIWTNR